MDEQNEELIKLREFPIHLEEYFVFRAAKKIAMND